MTLPEPASVDEPAGRWLLRRHADFRRLWLATTVSQLGTQVSELAIPLAAILLLHAGAFQVGLLATVGYLPLAVLGLAAGAWADRLPRWSILVAADVARGAALASIPIAYLLGGLHLAQLYVVTACVGAMTVFFDVAYPAYIPSLVARADLARANARLQVSEQGAAVLGPGLAGWLIGLIGAPLAVATDAFSYVASAAFVARIQRRETQRQRPVGRRSMRREIVEGVRVVVAHRQLRAIAVAAAITNLFGRTIVILVPLYLVRAAGYRATGIGIVFALGSIGFLLGAATADRTIQRLGIGPSIVVGATVAAASFVLVAAPRPSAAGPFTAAALFVYGVGALTFSIGNATLRQLTLPAEILGRTTSTMRMLIWLAQPVSGLVAVWLGTSLGLHQTLWICAVGTLLAPIPLYAGGLIGQRTATGPTTAPSPT